MLANARALRRNATDAERKLWSILRSHRLAGFKFRRQQPIGHYIADFVCFDRRLIVEADGGQHAESPRDVARDGWLAAQGFQVLRFWNNAILENPQGVATAIVAALSSPSPQPLSRKGRGAFDGSSHG